MDFGSRFGGGYQISGVGYRIATPVLCFVLRGWSSNSQRSSKISSCQIRSKFLLRSFSESHRHEFPAYVWSVSSFFGTPDHFFGTATARSGKHYRTTSAAVSAARAGKDAGRGAIWSAAVRTGPLARSLAHGRHSSAMHESSGRSRTSVQTFSAHVRRCD